MINVASLCGGAGTGIRRNEEFVDAEGEHKNLSVEPARDGDSSQFMVRPMNWDGGATGGNGSAGG